MDEPSTENLAGQSLARPWVLVLGAIFGAATLLFLMVLVFMSVSGHEIPCNSIFLVNMILSLGAALAAGFIGGNASATGEISVPLLQDNPIIISLAGGIAALVIMLVATFGLNGQTDCVSGLSVSCPIGSQAHVVDQHDFGFCYPREGWELDSAAVDINAADIYLRYSTNRDIGLHFHVSLIPDGWAGRPDDYTKQVANTWRQLDEDLMLTNGYVSGRDAYLFSLHVKDRNKVNRPTEITHIYLDRERLLEVIITWFETSEPSLISDLQRVKSSLVFERG